MSNDINFLPRKNIPNPSQNLVETLAEEDVKRIGEEARQGFQDDFITMHRRLREMDQIEDLFQMVHVKKTFPWDNASNIILPLINYTVNNFESRMSSNLFDIPKIVRASSIDRSIEETERAERVEKFFNFQLNFGQTDFKLDMVRTIHHFFLHGLGIRKVFYDDFQNKVVSRNVHPGDFIFDYNTTDLETSYRYSQILRWNFNELKILEKKGFLTDVGDVPLGTEDRNSRTDHARRNAGLNRVTTDYTEEFEVIEQHTYVKMNKEDIIRRPVIVTFARETGKVYRISDRVDPNSKNGEALKFFTVYPFLTNTNSLFGYGFGKLLFGLANGMNAITNQIVDAGTLSNTKSGLINARTFIGQDDFTIEMGKFRVVNSEDLRKDFLPINVTPPPGSSFSTLQFLMDQADRQTSITELQLGQVKSEVSATQASIANNNSNKQLTSAQSKFLIKFTEELNKLQSLYLIYTDHNEYAKIVLKKEEFESMDNKQKKKLMEEDLKSDVYLKPTADPRIVSAGQKLEEARNIQQLIAQSPFLAQDPSINELITEKFLDALNFSDDVKDQFSEAFERVQQAQQESVEIQNQQDQIVGEIQKLQGANQGVPATT